MPPNDPRKEVVYRNFAQNLDDLLRAGNAAGAAMVLSTVAVNLKDCPPFSSAPATNLPPTQAASFQQWCQAADTAWENGDYYRGGQLGSRPRPICARNRQSYSIGSPNVCYTRPTPPPQGRIFNCALDADALPFRADSRINGILIAAAKKHAGQKLGLCDAAGVLAAAAPEGVTGEESFYEHVHLNFDGNYLLARAWAGQIQTQLAGRLATRGGHQLAAAGAM